PRLLGWSRERRQARSRELLALVGLEPGEYLDRYPQDLSGGEQQRVGVARALAADPPVLLMDEPFGAVDPITRDRLQEEFLELQRRLRKTVVFVTHDLDEAIRLADRVCLMRDGAVEQFAPPERLLSAPATEFVERFVGSGRALKRLSRLAVAGIMRPAAGAAHVASVTPSADLRTALSSFLEHGASELDVVDESGERIGELLLDDIVALGNRE
ncbi:MAG TPA: ATP-binding cassette domain-containing protein, partial [Trueperaceae bacterium]|nr:ATP-binding cassette domain-containing protein [Trueperaceae bacterium]